ncbi:MAG: DUF3558 domain-containing protein [Mycobacteriaceae bacterium]
MTTNLSTRPDYRRRHITMFCAVIGVCLLVAGCEATVSGTPTAPSGANKYRDPVTFDPCTDFPPAAFETMRIRRTNNERADFTVPYSEADGGPEMRVGCHYQSDAFRMTIWAENVRLDDHRKAIGKVKIWDTTLAGRNAVMTIPDNDGSCNMYVEIPGGAIAMLLDNQRRQDAATADECAAVTQYMTLLEPFFPKQI